MRLKEAVNQTLLSAAAVATSVILFALPIYYAWKLVASFRRAGIPHWPPAVALSLWCLQWPLFLVAAAGRCGLHGRRLWRFHAQLARAPRHSHVQLRCSLLAVAALCGEKLLRPRCEG
jgi:hypothetical protein